MIRIASIKSIPNLNPHSLTSKIEERGKDGAVAANCKSKLCGRRGVLRCWAQTRTPSPTELKVKTKRIDYAAKNDLQTKQ